MPSTITTTEILEKDITPKQVKELIRLRIQAGAIRCWQEGNKLLTEWNVLGEND